MVAKLTIQFTGWPPYCKIRFFFNTGGKGNQTTRRGTVYLGVDEQDVGEVFLCIGMCW